MDGCRRLWRWRRNPLKRGTDRAEAWAVLAAGLVLAVGAPAAGTGAALIAEASAPGPAPSWHPVSAVLTRKAPDVSGGIGSSGLQVRAPVLWRAADGTSHTGRALVAPDTPAGSRITIWLDPGGTLRDNPADPRETMARAIAYGAVAASGTAVVAGGGYAFVRSRLDRRRDAQWAREWALIGPQWRRPRT